VRQALGKILDIEGEPVLTRLFRFHRGSPQYEVGHLERLTAIEERVAAIPGMFLTGSGFRAIGIPDCVADARATATQAIAFLATKDTKTG
jgi:oxygen-dependent protoporphyrinogen oxidase